MDSDLSDIKTTLFDMAQRAIKDFCEIIKNFAKAFSSFVDTVNSWFQEHLFPAQAVLHHREIHQEVDCPTSGREKMSLDQMIIHLNDRHKWTREKIADWLDTLPNQPVFYPNI